MSDGGGRMSDGADDRLSVLMLPDYSDDNPYQEQLHAALSRRGVRVSFGDVTGVAPVLGDWYRNGRPDVVHVHWIHTFIDTDRSAIATLLGVRLLLELLAVRLLGIDVVWTVHNLQDHERRHPRLELALRKGVAWLATRMIVHCDRAREQVRRAYGLSDRVADRIEVVPHGHYLDDYPNETTRAAARRELDLPADAVVVLYFGLIREYKNVPELIDAFRDLDADRARLLVVGNPWNEDVRERVGDACEGDERVQSTLKYVPEEEVQVYMNAADVVALPFASVLTSGSALLAMSFGRALIVPDVGCPGEIVGDEGGVLYDPERPGALTDALERTLAVADDLPAMGQRNRRTAERFDWDGIAADTHAVYRREPTTRSCDRLDSCAESGRSGGPVQSPPGESGTGRPR